MSNVKSYTPHLNDGTGLTDLTFNDSGNKMYLVNNSGNKIHEYDVDTPFDITTAIKRDNILTQTNMDKDIVIVDNGSKLITKTGSTVVAHDLEENYNISTWNNTATSSKRSMLSCAGFSSEEICSELLSPSHFTSIISFGTAMVSTSSLFSVSVPVLSLKTYSTYPNSSFKLLD